MRIYVGGLRCGLMIFQRTFRRHLLVITSPRMVLLLMKWMGSSMVPVRQWWRGYRRTRHFEANAVPRKCFARSLSGRAAGWRRIY